MCRKGLSVWVEKKTDYLVDKQRIALWTELGYRNRILKIEETKGLNATVEKGRQIRSSRIILVEIPLHFRAVEELTCNRNAFIVDYRIRPISGRFPVVTQRTLFIYGTYGL